MRHWAKVLLIGTLTFLPLTAIAQTPDLTASQAETVKLTPTEATITASDNPLSAPATVLHRAGDTLYLGLPDGGIAWWDTKQNKGMVVRPAEVLGAVKAIAVLDDGSIWWRAGISDRLFAVVPGPSVWSVVSTAIPSGIERLAPFGKRLALLGNGLTYFLNPKTSAFESPDSVLPADLAQQLKGGASLYFGSAAGVRDLLAVTALPESGGSHLTAWSGRADNLTERQSYQTPQPNLATAFALSPYGFAVLEGKGGRREQVQMALGTDVPGVVKWQPRTFPTAIPNSPNSPQSPQIISLGGSGLWFAENGTVQHTDLATGKREAYLPWNGAGATIRALCADRDGVYIATEKGVRYVRPGKPNEDNGYDGYMKVALGEETLQPENDKERTIASVIEEWQGVPYHYGGETKEGVDCSGFVLNCHKAVGVNMPRTSSDMRDGKQGKRIVDELHYGDVLCLPGHVAMYIGNGCTAEALNSGVGKAAIWRRKQVVVKRFLP